MSVSDVSSVNTLAQVASGMQSDQVMGQITAAVLKQIQEQQNQQAQALIQMIQAQPTLDGTGQVVNVGA
jgi:hypothetical protein